jgi:large conductance mechanosensitive channel
LILAFVVFLLVRAVTRVYKKPEVTATTKPCPYCAEAIPLSAKKCGHCTSDLAPVAVAT